MRIALVTEGSYPHSLGGVSVWCDQLVRGLPEHDFEVVSITGTGGEQLAFDLPPNVVRLQTVPLWGTPGRRQPRRRDLGTATGDGLHPRRRATFVRRSPRALDDVTREFGRALVAPEIPDARAGFRAALSAWGRSADQQDLERAILSQEFVTLLMDELTSHRSHDVWHGTHLGEPTVGDVVTASRLITHTLRPLTAGVPQVDVVHLVANGVAGLTGLAAKWRDGTPYVLSEHGVYLRERYLSFSLSDYSWPLKWLMLRFYRLLTGAVYSEAALVAPGNVYNRRWERWDGVPESSIRTVYNGVDPAEFTPGDADEPAVPTIAFVGRIDPIKDLVTLVRGFAVVRAGLPAARLRIFGGVPAGNESYAGELRTLVRSLGLEEAVTFEGRVDIIQDAYGAGHVVALTSVSEGFPYTVIEAMSSGRATVSTDVGGVAEAVGPAGVIVPPRDPEAFGQACLELLRDHERRRAYETAARDRVIELYTLERSLNAFRTVYDDVVADQVEKTGLIQLGAGAA